MADVCGDCCTVLRMFCRSPLLESCGMLNEDSVGLGFREALSEGEPLVPPEVPPEPP